MKLNMLKTDYLLTARWKKVLKEKENVTVNKTCNL